MGRLALRDLRCQRPPARLHHLERCPNARLPELLDERGDVSGHSRADVRVDDRGARPLVLPDLRQDLRRAGHVHLIADGCPNDLLDPALVRIVGVRVEKRNRDRLDVLLPQFAGDVLDRGFVEIAPDLAARTESLGYFVPEAARDERRHALVLDVVENGDAETSHLEDVSESLRRDQGRQRATTLEDRVRRNGRGVDDTDDLGPVDPALGEQGCRSGDNGSCVVVRSGQHLLRPHRAVVTEQHDVRERAADVDAEAERTW